MKRRVVITGLGVVSPLGSKLDIFWDNLLAGKSGVKSVSLFDVTDFRSAIGGEISDWKPGDHIDVREAKRLDRFAQFGYVAGREAVADAGIDFAKEPDPHRLAVIYGVGIGGLGTIEEQAGVLKKRGVRKMSALTIPKLIPDAVTGTLSIHYGLRGVNYTVATACASSINAMGNALKMIQLDEADIVLAGGAEAALTQVGLGAFAALRALSTRNDEPERASRPWDVNRDGFVLGEGAGCLIFEELEHAKARGAKIYAEVKGFGASSDATHITQPDENGSGAANAIEQAIRSSGLLREEIDYINAHGTSTPLGDIAETIAVKRVFGEHAKNINLSSTKSQIGHLLGASGAVEMIASVLAMQNGVIPATINLEDQDPKCDLNYTALQPCERNIGAFLKNSFGFGGHNACLIVQKFSG